MNSDFRVNDLNDGIAVSLSAGVPFNPVSDTCITRLTSEGKIAVGVLYTRYTGIGGSVRMHVAAFERRWHTPAALRIGFSYPFEQLHVRKVFAEVHEKYTHARRFYRLLGFEHETRLKDCFADGDLIVLSMYKRSCRFLPKLH